MPYSWAWVPSILQISGIISFMPILLPTLLEVYPEVLTLTRSTFHHFRFDFILTLWPYDHFYLTYYSVFRQNCILMEILSYLLTKGSYLSTSASIQYFKVQIPYYCSLCLLLIRECLKNSLHLTIVVHTADPFV